MRTARVKMKGGGYYHCISRVIERRMAFGEDEKEMFRKMMRKVEDFSGVKVLTYAVFSNHFHILAHVPKRVTISDAELIRRLRVVYGKTLVDQYEALLKQARAGLRSVMLSFGNDMPWSQVSHKYRKLLYVRGQRTEKKSGFSAEEVEKVVAEGGKLPAAAVLRCRVRYFSDGVVLGSKGFVEKVFKQYRGEFGRKRKTGARAMKWAEWDGLCTMRDLRLEVVSVSDTG